MAYFQTWDAWWATQNQQTDWYDKGLNAEDARQWWIANISGLPPAPSPIEPEPPVPTPIPPPMPPIPTPEPIPIPVAGVLPGMFTRIIIIDGIKYMGTFNWNGHGYDLVKKDQYYRVKSPYQNVEAKIYNPSELSAIIGDAYGKSGIALQNGQDYYYGIPFECYDDALSKIQMIIDLADVAGGLPVGNHAWGARGYGTRDCDDYAHFCLAMLRLFWPGCAASEVFGTAYNQTTAGHAWDLVINEKGEIKQIDLTQVIGPPRPSPISSENTISWVYF